MADDGPIFPGFLDDDGIYLAATEFWRATSERLLASLGATDWDFRGAFRYGNGALHRDGNPMFELWHEPMAKVVRLIQVEADPGEPMRFSAYMDTRNWDDSGREIVIWCVLTPRAVEVASGLMARWIEPATTAEEMQAEIDRVLGPRPPYEPGGDDEDDHDDED